MASMSSKDSVAEDITVGFVVIFGVIGLFAMIPLLIINSGLAVSILWGWFIVPLGAPQIGVAHAIGISATMFFVKSGHVRRDNEDKKPWVTIAGFFIAPWVSVLVGYIAKGFM